MEIEQKNRMMLFPRINKGIIILFALVFIITALRGYQLFQYIFEENVKTEGSITIPENASLEQVSDSLKKYDILNDYKAFNWISKRKDYGNNIKPGKYSFKKGMNTNQLVNMLKAGNQKPVKVTFNNIRFFDELAGAVAKYIQPDSATLYEAFVDPAIQEKYGFSEYTIPCMFIPNTYEFYWTTTPEQFMERMNSEYRKFWNSERKEKAAALQLSPEEVITIASIVQEETIKADEKPKVAGVYINRIKKGMYIQACPTIKYALKDFTIQRVLNEHLIVNSPYNTYKNKGLPPGPINFPEISSIEAVLNAENHKYLYMCAKDDFSGYHNFAKTLIGHNINARKYQRFLNKNKIFK